jgi:hypothetical protein
MFAVRSQQKRERIRRGALELAFNRFEHGVGFREVTRLQLRMNLVTINADFKCATTGRNKLERADALL